MNKFKAKSAFGFSGFAYFPQAGAGITWMAPFGAPAGSFRGIFGSSFEFPWTIVNPHTTVCAGALNDGCGRGTGAGARGGAGFSGETPLSWAVNRLAYGFLG